MHCLPDYLITSFIGSSFFFFFFLGLHPCHMEVPMLGVESELQLPAYTEATATPDPSHVCNLHHSSQQHGILNPLSEARDHTCNLMVPSGMVSALPQQEFLISNFFFKFILFCFVLATPAACGSS